MLLRTGEEGRAQQLKAYEQRVPKQRVPRQRVHSGTVEPHAGAERDTAAKQNKTALKTANPAQGHKAVTKMHNPSIPSDLETSIKHAVNTPQGAGKEDKAQEQKGDPTEGDQTEGYPTEGA